MTGTASVIITPPPLSTLCLAAGFKCTASDESSRERVSMCGGGSSILEDVEWFRVLSTSSTTTTIIETAQSIGRANLLFGGFQFNSWVGQVRVLSLSRGTLRFHGPFRSNVHTVRRNCDPQNGMVRNDLGVIYLPLSSTAHATFYSNSKRNKMNRPSLSK